MATRCGALARALRGGRSRRGAAGLDRCVRALPADRRRLRRARRPRRGDRADRGADRARALERRRCARCVRPRRSSRGDVARCGAPCRRSRSRRWTTRSAPTRSSRTPSATCSAGSPRPTAGRACVHRRVAGGDRRGGRDAACGARGRGALAPVQAGLNRLRAELDAIRRAHDGHWPRLDALSRAERQRLNGRLGAGLELLATLPGRSRRRYRPRSRAAAVKLDRRRFLRSVPARRGRRRRGGATAARRPARAAAGTLE